MYRSNPVCGCPTHVQHLGDWWNGFAGCRGAAGIFCSVGTRIVAAFPTCNRWTSFIRSFAFSLPPHILCIPIKLIYDMIYDFFSPPGMSVTVGWARKVCGCLAVSHVEMTPYLDYCPQIKLTEIENLACLIPSINMHINVLIPFSCHKQPLWDLWSSVDEMPFLPVIPVKSSLVELPGKPPFFKNTYQ